VDIQTRGVQNVSETCVEFIPYSDADRRPIDTRGNRRIVIEFLDGTKLRSSGFFLPEGAWRRVHRRSAKAGCS